jgi:hypothetical protein
MRGHGLLAPRARPENLLPGFESLLSKGRVCNGLVVSTRASLPAAHPAASSSTHSQGGGSSSCPACSGPRGSRSRRYGRLRVSRTWRRVRWAQQQQRARFEMRQGGYRTMEDGGCSKGFEGASKHGRFRAFMAVADVRITSSAKAVWKRGGARCVSRIRAFHGRDSAPKLTGPEDQRKKS